jgi:subfamily B ATP-binding cassette protein MsbA
MDDLHLLKKYFLPYQKKLVVITLLSLVCGLFEAVSLGALVPLINIIATNQEPTGNIWNLLKGFFQFLSITLNTNTLLFTLAIIFLVGQVLIFIRQSWQIDLRFEFVRDLKEQVFSHIMHADLSYNTNKKIGNFLDTILVETEQAGSGLFVITDLFSNICLITVYLMMLIYISFDMTIICIVVVAVMLYFVNKLLERSKFFGERRVDSNTEINEYTTERLSLLKLIKANSTEDRESDLFSKITDRFRDNNTKFVINGAKIELFFQSIIALVAILLVYLSLSVFNLSLGLIIVFLFILIRLTTPLRSINNQRHELAGLMASLIRVDQNITEAQITTSLRDGKTRYPGITESIFLQDVSYAYDTEKLVLQNVTLKIKKNEMVALVGPSGGGKSTLVDLIIRLIDPTYGVIGIDGIDLKGYNVKSYHTKVSLVSQDIFIFNESVLFNICYGTDEVSLNRAKNAAKIAFADEFIEKLSDGYNTPLGDRGVKLSGGQKQRIALARAIYKNPDILILDEATSALDSESEKNIQTSINTIKHKYTIIVVAHRLSTIENADKIVVIEGGRVIETGTHDSLKGLNGTYAKYYAMQHGKQTI